MQQQKQFMETNDVSYMLSSVPSLETDAPDNSTGATKIKKKNSSAQNLLQDWPEYK